MRAATVSALVLTAWLGLGCRGMDPPYPPGQGPSDEELLDHTEPELDALQVPRAKVRQGAGPAANLMLVAQAPARFTGTIQVAGNELVTLAVNELEYGLRWVGGREGAEALTPGYYSGPPSRCAVETLLGVDLEPQAFVELVLGGAPLIDGPHHLVDQRWDRKAGRERLTIRNDAYQQELAFGWHDGHWQFVGATLWWLDGDEPRWLWTVSHEAVHEVGGHVVPKKTAIERPLANGKRQTINVTFLKQVPNPALGGSVSADPPPELDPDEGESEGNEGDTWEEDDWDDDGDWENADGTHAPDGESAGSDVSDSGPPAIPPQFLGNPTGLTARGDLCAGRP